MKKGISLLLICILLLGVVGCGQESAPLPTSTPEATATPTVEPTAEPTPEPTPTPEPIATEITGLKITDTICGINQVVVDGDRASHINYWEGTSLTIQSEEPIYSLYLYWYEEPSTFTIEYEGHSLLGGENKFIHEYIAIPDGSCEITFTFSGISPLAEIRAFGAGAMPEDVQVWQLAPENVDVLVCCCHADDDIIFFGGVLADAIARGLTVQVAYFVNHYSWQAASGELRPQELLDALWDLGLRNYPDISDFPDVYVMSYEAAEAQYGLDNAVNYYIELLNKRHPQVVFGHDRQGEYGHGAHQLASYALETAVTQSAEQGLWDVPKLYLHFAEENSILIDVETPLEFYNGKTAFQMATEAMEYHVSQLIYPHRPTLDDPEFPRYDCRNFGLVRSQVGLDTGNDYFEHLTPTNTNS